MTYLRFLIGLIISGVALYIAFVGVEWSDVSSALGEANYLLLVGGLPIMLTLFLLRAHRWRLLFYPDRQVSLLSTFGALNVGYMAGNVLPLQLGEVAKAYVLSEAEQIGKVRVLSTIAVERVLDVLFLLALLGALIPFIDLPRAATISAVVLLAAFTAIAILIVIAVIDRLRVERWLDRWARFLPHRVQGTAQNWGASLLDGLSALSNLRILVYVSVLTVASWLLSASIIYLIMRAFSLDVPVTAAPFLLVATSLGFFVPSSPGALGVYEAISIRSLETVFSVAQEPATSYALVAHAFYLIPPTILGALFFWWHHLNLRRIQTWSTEDAPEVPPQPAGTPQPVGSQGSVAVSDPPETG